MPKVVKSFNWSAIRTSRHSRYPWDEWLDGQTREFTQEDMEDSDPQKFIGKVRFAAQRRDKRIRATKTEQGSVILMAEPMTPEEAKVNQQRLKARNEKWMARLKEKQKEKTAAKKRK